ncbi:hypothetical protein GCM10025868_30260 [Angustibacter aerolatus]|uniref:Thioester reductase (TE) domain-containing protein n=1 Tax=Angustibacter aerolatus TaxID=1162965 RepID=A0ABQ6JHR3_9ACTN|nr:hypothetical protein GCM10025868_30260 [Angustibacter aerolatus]
MRATNVEGTQRVLAVAGAARRPPLVVHVSTAFVAGARRRGVVREGDLDASTGFENPYERSKHDGEQVVHAWCAQPGRRAVVLRPSILVSRRPPHPEPARPPAAGARADGPLGRGRRSGRCHRARAGRPGRSPQPAAGRRGRAGDGAARRGTPGRLGRHLPRGRRPRRARAGAHRA